MERIPKPGEFYRHFKDKLYQIVAIAKHSETGEPMVVYQALYGDFAVYVRPLEMFVSPVDREKYPEVEQEYRFERVELQGDGESGVQASEHRPAEKDPLNPLVVPFVEAESYEQKLELLSAMWGRIGQEELDVLSISLDLPQRGGSVEAQLDTIEKYLRMQLHFDGKRLR